jgi:hypothetical protein
MEPESKKSATLYILVAVTSSWILKVKLKLGVTFNFDKQDVIDFTKISKMTMCRAFRSKFRKVVIDPLFFGQKIYKGLLFYQ